MAAININGNARRKDGQSSTIVGTCCARTRLRAHTTHTLAHMAASAHTAAATTRTHTHHTPPHTHARWKKRGVVNDIIDQKINHR